MKKNKKLCLISINSYNELTGGGVYLRTLVSFLQKQNVNLTLIDKKSSGKLFEDNTFQHISFIKGKRQDIISRLFFIPSFYVPYIFSIIKILRKQDILAFHNSRLGL
ncbi:glycosyl transferase family 1, partial [Escherichia coli]